MSASLASFCLALCAVIVGCGDGVTREASITRFQTDNPDVSPEQSTCVVDRLVERYGTSDLGVELERKPLDAGFQEAQFRAMFVCGVEGDVVDEITEQLTASGVAADDAPCVADELFQSMEDDDIDVLLSGEITPEYSEKFYTALESCDAL